MRRGEGGKGVVRIADGELGLDTALLETLTLLQRGWAG